jgi:hypothetical protein
LTPGQAKWALNGNVIAGDILGQFSMPGIMTDHIKPATDKGVRRDLHFILEKKAAGTVVKLKFGPNTDTKPHEHFAWKDTKGQYTDLMLEKEGAKDRPVMRYMYKAYDTSSGENRNKTYKIFHHLFDPTGNRLVTNGGQTDEGYKNMKILYPHHRGLCFGFNKVTYGENLKKKADTWHCTGDAHLSHEGFLQIEAGIIMARHRVAVDWHGEKKEVFAKEEREMTVYNLPGGTMVDFASRLKTTGGKVKLDGDPQHAGFQFRAANEVSEKSAKQTYYLRPDGKGGLGETRNWPGSKGHVNLPWDALSFVLGDQRYTVCYINSPSNPREARFSERDYGRFGSYVEYDLTEDHPLVLNYRIWLQAGEMMGNQVQSLSNQFVSPPKEAAK